jgi:hypothetical protein
MRKWHRWVSLLTSLFMGVIALSGLMLQFDWYFSGRQPPTSLFGDMRAGERPPAAGSQELPAISPETPPPEAAACAPPPGEGPGNDGWIKGYSPQHGWLQNLHAGYFMGTFGRWLSIAMASGLLVLSVSGIVMYVQMHGARSRIGRKSLFWH